MVPNGDTANPADPVSALAAIHSPDNIETTTTSLLIQEDPSPLALQYAPGDSNGTMARIWQYIFATGELRVVAEVDQSLDPTARWGLWESSGIVDASSHFGRGVFLVNVQAHTSFTETAVVANPLYPGSGADDEMIQKREAGQLVLLRIPGA